MVVICLESKTRSSIRAVLQNPDLILGSTRRESRSVLMPPGLSRMIQAWPKFPAAWKNRFRTWFYNGKSVILKVSKPRSFPTAEGGKKSIWYRPNRRFCVGKGSENCSTISQFYQKSIRARYPLVWPDFFATASVIWQILTALGLIGWAPQADPQWYGAWSPYGDDLGSVQVLLRVRLPFRRRIWFLHLLHV